MAYSADKKPGELTALTSLATDDVIVVGDTSDASEVAKGITKANLITDLTTSFATAGHNHTGVYAPALGADDNYVTDAEKIVIGNTSGTNTGDNAVNSNYSGLVTNATHTGDVTGATALTIAAKAVTLAKMDDVATGTVFYRKTALTGAPEVQTLATLKTDLGLTGTNSGDQTSIAGITGTKAQFDTAVTDGNFMYTGDAPTSHTHALSEITDSTSEALGVGTLELGHATDTTLSRVSAGVVAVEGVTVPTISSTNTLTNKRVTKRIGSTTSSATPTINTDNYDVYRLTAQTVDITSFTTNLSGTPTHDDNLIIEITGTAARAITWGASFEASTVALPTTTVTTAMLKVGFQYNDVTSKWRCIAVA